MKKVFILLAVFAAMAWPLYSVNAPEEEIGRAKAFIQEKEFRLAETALAALWAEFPDDARLPSLLGFVSEKRGLYEAAEDYYLQSINMDVNSFDAHYGLGVVLFKTGEKQKAAK